MKAEITLKSYILAVIVLLSFGVVVGIILVSVPYLTFLVLKTAFNDLQFGLSFVVLFWFLVVILLWMAKLLSVINERLHT